MAKNDTPAIVCDAGPIIHLDELNGLSLLADFCEVLSAALAALLDRYPELRHEIAVELYRQDAVTLN
ncbi:MAG: hypothetical protein ACE5LU_23465 [Anaerolineae bacterium]